MLSTIYFDYNKKIQKVALRLFLQKQFKLSYLEYNLINQNYLNMLTFFKIIFFFRKNNCFSLFPNMHLMTLLLVLFLEFWSNSQMLVSPREKKKNEEISDTLSRKLVGDRMQLKEKNENLDRC